jgi:hypothetical protein
MEPEKKDGGPPIEKKKIRVYRTVSVWDPSTKKTKTKHISGYDPEEVLRNCVTWKDETKAKFAAKLDEAKPKGPLFPLTPYTDPEMPTNGAVSWVLVGASRSGKSTFMKHLLKEHYKKHITCMMTLSSAADIYKDLSKKIIVATDWNPVVIEDMYRLNSKMDNKFNFLVVTDDLVGGAIKTDLQMTRLLSLYRNSNISAIISGQQATLINAAGRSNANFIAVFHQNSAGEAKRVVDLYLTAFFPTHMKVSEKIQLFMKLTEDHAFFFINNLNNTCTLVKLGAH